MTGAFVAPSRIPGDFCEVGFQRVQPVVAKGINVTSLTICADKTSFWVRNDDESAIWLVRSAVNMDLYHPPKQSVFRQALAEAGVPGFAVFPFQRNHFLSSKPPVIALAPLEVHAAWQRWDKTMTGQAELPEGALKVVKTIIKVTYEDIKTSPPREIWPPKAGNWAAIIAWVCLRVPKFC